VALRSERVFVQLKARLLQGDFPLNVRLGEERLAHELQVSRTPVREALVRLHAEGLVVRGLDGGFVPSAPDVSAMRYLYEARAALELAALRRPRTVDQSVDRELLAALRDDWRALTDDVPGGARPAPDPGFVLLDESFHVTLARAAGNPAIVDLLRQVNERIRIVRMQDFLDGERIRQTITEHLGIVEAVLDDDLVEAEARFVAHLDLSLAVVEWRVQRALARMVAGPTVAPGTTVAPGKTENHGGPSHTGDNPGGTP
jgi:DNA-binding GntR family transcriptional regulator